MTSFAIQKDLHFPERYQLTLPSKPEDRTRDRITQWISQYFEGLNTKEPFTSSMARIVHWQNGEELFHIKEKAFVTLNGVYILQSRKALRHRKEYKGGFKMGKVILAYFRKDHSQVPLLLMYNIPSREVKIQEHNIANIEHEIEVMQTMRDVPGVQKIQDSLCWVTKKAYQKKGFICVKQDLDLYEVVHHERSPDCLPWIPRPLIKNPHNLLLLITEGAKDIFLRGFMQRDFKPENILFNFKTQLPIFIDLASCYNTTIEPARFQGTPAYISPEYALLYLLTQHESKPKIEQTVLDLCVSERNTVFSLGIIFLMIVPPTGPLKAWYQSIMPSDRKSFLAKLCQERAQKITPQFREELCRLQNFSPELAKEIPVGISPSSIPNATPFENLVLEMISGNPRARPTLEQVHAKLSTLSIQRAASEYY
jgi:serine/threonine protein kinase